MLLVAVGEGRTLSGAEGASFHAHVAGCEGCRTLMEETANETADGQLRWVARLPEDAFDDPDLLVLPTVDPIVFAKGEELAHGGMGRITRARDRRLGREVAIKEVLAPYLRARFEREATITAKLQHPAIVPVYEAGAWPDGSAFYTMRLVSGGTLGEAIEKAGSFEARLALLPHVLALTEALGYAHARRIVHRDLKPGNVLVGEFGETVVIDWGLAKDLDRSPGGGGAGGEAGGGEADRHGSDVDSAELTRAGSIIGTPCFIAPEQAAGAAIDERADVYALGAILYNLLAGHPPYWDCTEHSAELLLAAAREVSPTPIEQLAPRTPADLRAIVERAMARDPAARYPSAKEMAEELRRFEAGQLLGSREYRLHEILTRWIRRHRAAVTVGAVALGVLAIVIGVSVGKDIARQRETRRMLAESQLEQGRQLLVEGDPGQAASYLAAAVAELPDDPVARRLATIALRHAPRRLGSFEGTVAAFRPGVRELAIGQSDGSIVVIDPATAARLRTMPSLGGEITALAYSPDGSRLAVASQTGAYLRDAGTGAQTAVTSEVQTTELRFLPGGQRLAVATAAAVIVVALDGKRLAADEHVTEPRGLVASGDILVAATRDGAVAWRTTDLVRIAQVRDASAPRFAALFDRGDLITAGVDGVRRWSPWAGHVTTLVSRPSVTLTWVADHRLLADGTLIDTATNAVEPMAHDGIQAAAIIDPTHVIVGGYDRTLRVWDLVRPARPTVVLDAADATDALIVDPTGTRAASRGASAHARVELWDVAHTYMPASSTAIGARIDALLTDHRDRLAVHVQDDGAGVTKLVTTGLEVRATVPGWPIGFRPNGDELVTDHEGVLSIYASRDGRHLRDLDEPEKIWHLAFSSSGAVAATSSPHHVTLRDASWRALPRGIDVPADLPAISVIAVDDHDHVVTGHDDGTLRIWDARTGAQLAKAAAHTSHVTGLELRGDTLFTGGWDGMLRRWAFPSGEARGIFKSFDDVSISPSGTWIASADGSAAVGLLDGTQVRLFERLPATDGLAHVAFLDDDHVVVAGGGDRGRLEVIDLSERLLTAGEVKSLVNASSRWQLVRGRAIERP